MTITSTGVKLKVQTRSTFRVRKETVYILAALLINTELIALALHGKPLVLLPWQWALSCLAIFRLARLIAFDTVLQPWRSPFVRVGPHDSGAGDTTFPRTDAGPLREVIGELITCPICIGTWISTFIVYGWTFFPTYTSYLVGVMSLIAVVEFLHCIFETIQWQGERTRHALGRELTDTNKGG